MEKTSPGKESTKRGMAALALALAAALALFALIATSFAAAQSAETPDPLELYDANDDGVIDADEAIAAAADGQVTGQSRPAACVEYDHNNNGVIDRERPWRRRMIMTPASSIVIRRMQLSSAIFPT